MQGARGSGGVQPFRIGIRLIKKELSTKFKF